MKRPRKMPLTEVKGADEKINEEDRRTVRSYSKDVLRRIEKLLKDENEVDTA